MSYNVTLYRLRIHMKLQRVTTKTTIKYTNTLHGAAFNKDK